MVRTVLIFSGGASLTAHQKANLPAADMVLAADSGVDRAHDCDFEVDVAVGDFDSVSDDGLRQAKASGARIIAHPAVKNETDLELALLEAQRLGVERVVVVALDGGRADHYLANLALLADPRFRSQSIAAQLGDGWVSVIHDRHEMQGTEGEVVSLLPMGGAAAGVRTDGLLYPLRDETLEIGSPRGMSNHFAGTTALVELRAGTLLCIRPNVSQAPRTL